MKHAPRTALFLAALTAAAFATLAPAGLVAAESAIPFGRVVNNTIVGTSGSAADDGFPVVGDWDGDAAISAGR